MRFTVDLRLVNRYIYALHLTLPLIEVELDKAGGAKIFCKFDMTRGYWELLLHDDSHGFQSFITPDAIFTPTHVLLGNINANSHLQDAFISEIPLD